MPRKPKKGKVEKQKIKDMTYIPATEYGITMTNGKDIPSTFFKDNNWYLTS